MPVKMTNPVLYMLNQDGEYKLFETAQDLELECTSDDFTEDQSYISSINDLRASFECVGKLATEAIMAFFGIRHAVFRCCPNKRVVYLALHAKKSRIRKKNFNRAIKILEKENK